MTKKHLKSMIAFALAVVLTTTGVVSGAVVGKDSAGGSSTINYDLPPQHGNLS